LQYNKDIDRIFLLFQHSFLQNSFSLRGRYAIQTFKAISFLGQRLAFPAKFQAREQITAKHKSQIPIFIRLRELILNYFFMGVTTMTNVTTKRISVMRGKTYQAT
jgi:hypothetical protein